MKLPRLAEQELIAAIRADFSGKKQGGLALGIGDDAAVMPCLGEDLLLLTTDTPLNPARQRQTRRRKTGRKQAYRPRGGRRRRAS
jgi:thiamine monophosphate kinase